MLILKKKIFKPNYGFKKMVKIRKRRIEKRLKAKTDLKLKELVSMLEKSNNEFWLKVARYLVRPRSKAIEVNLRKIDKEANDGDIVLVPGKVLGDGILNKKITIACYKASNNAKNKIEFSKSKLMSIAELYEKNKKGNGIKLIV